MYVVGMVSANKNNLVNSRLKHFKSTLEDPVPNWKGHFQGPLDTGPLGGPPPSFTTPPGPGTPTLSGPGTPGFPGSGFPGPSPGPPPHTPGGGQLVPCGPSSGSHGGFVGSPAGNSGSSTPGPCGPPPSNMSGGSGGGGGGGGMSLMGPNGPMPPMSMHSGPPLSCGTPNHCGPANSFHSSQFNGLGPCGPCVPNSPSNCGPPVSSHLRGHSPSRPGSSGPPFHPNAGSPFPPFGPGGPPPGMMGPMPGGPNGPPPFMGPPGPNFGPPHGHGGSLHPGMSPQGPSHGSPMGPHGPMHGPPPPFMDRIDPGFRGRHLPIPQPDYRIHEMNKRLQQRTDESDNLWWDAFATEFFEDDANITLTFCLEDGPKRYSIGRTLIPRYFRSIFEGGVTDLRYELRHPKESFHNTSITMDCDQCAVVSLHGKPMFTKVYTEGRLIVEFTFDDMMRIRSWHFAVRNHRELIPRSILAMQEPGMVESLSKNITRQGMTSTTLNYLRLCVILEPMQELMSRHKAYALSPRDCLKTTLFQKWQKMVAPPESSRPTNKRRKRKGAAGAAGPPGGTLGRPLPLHGPPVSSSAGVVGGCGLGEGFPSGPPGGWGPPGPPLPPTSSQSSGPPSSTSSSSQPPMDKSESTKKSPKNR
ncbi:hypothetical protein TCAL_00143 [Tigriopus californicus]|uniref:LIM interaction domain-containing protein n=1 Tax=Tigriopus californicus TaxID=6832 RepID=A0A553PI91_TIGCA|nr:hypothetical protein TCAL_00143 [Tigriopus californicus]